jgi:hypothetical protein
MIQKTDSKMTDSKMTDSKMTEISKNLLMSRFRKNLVSSAKPYSIIGIGCVLLSLIANQSALGASYETIYGVGELTDLSSKVLTGRVDRISSFAQDGLIYSNITIDVSKTYVGKQNRTESITVLGGKVGDVRLSVSGAPQFNSEEDVLLFLDGDEVVGFGQGRFEVVDGVAKRSHMNKGVKNVGDDKNRPSLQKDSNSEFKIEDTLPDEREAQNCLDVMIDDDYDDGWQLRTLHSSNTGEQQMKAYPVTLLAGNNYEIAVCTDEKVKAVDIALADSTGEFIDESVNEGREGKLQFSPKKTGTYYVTVNPYETKEAAERVGISMGLLYK